jgi:hypothetical protein
MERKIIAMAVLGLLLAGCSTARTGSLCTAAIHPRYGRQRALDGHGEPLAVTLNSSGEAICGWKAP